MCTLRHTQIGTLDQVSYLRMIYASESPSLTWPLQDDDETRYQRSESVHGSGRSRSLERIYQGTTRRRHSRSPSSPVLFYRRGEPYYECVLYSLLLQQADYLHRFTNFSPHPITLHGRIYPTAEHRKPIISQLALVTKSACSVPSAQVSRSPARPC
jgi:hypothetical protein